MGAEVTGQNESQLSLPAVGGRQEAELVGDVVLPSEKSALVIFAHGSGSSRRSSRNRWVAGELQKAGLGTLLMDLLTADEARYDEQTAELRFDIDLLTRRVLGMIDWLATHKWLSHHRVGLFGASTGAAAALGAAAHRPERVGAVVSRGGRPDLASEDLSLVKAPTLLVVGGRDEHVLKLNRDVAERLTAPHQVQVVNGATHLFEEPGALEQVASAATEWLRHHVNAHSS